MLEPDAGLPTLSSSILTPLGGYASQGLFGVTYFSWVHNATALLGWESILALISTGILALAALWCYLKLQQARQ